MNISKVKDISKIVLYVLSSLGLAVIIMTMLTMMVFVMFHMLFLDTTPRMIEFSMTFKVCFFIFMLSVWVFGIFVEYRNQIREHKRFLNQ